jgi:hypothetical protein
VPNSSRDAQGRWASSPAPNGGEGAGPAPAGPAPASDPAPGNTSATPLAGGPRVPDSFSYPSAAEVLMKNAGYTGGQGGGARPTATGIRVEQPDYDKLGLGALGSGGALRAAGYGSDESGTRIDVGGRAGHGADVPAAGVPGPGETQPGEVEGGLPPSAGAGSATSANEADENV